MKGQSLKMSRIYHACSCDSWRAAERIGHYPAAPAGEASDYIHFSTPAQLPQSLRIHMKTAKELVLIEVETRDLGEALKWEASRGGEDFPHLYGRLALNKVRRRWDLERGEDGEFLLPEFGQDC